LDLGPVPGYQTRAKHVLSKNETGGNAMKTWTKPAVREQEVGLEVTSYLPAEIDVI
jgi:coenzyme PQQ precursor peptide PqqA